MLRDLLFVLPHVAFNPHHAPPSVADEGALRNHIELMVLALQLEDVFYREELLSNLVSEALVTRRRVRFL